MNRIESAEDTFDFKTPYGDNKFLSIKIDGEWIDKLLDKFYPGNDIEGTISTLSFRLESDEEERIVWERFLPAKGGIAISPILMCPDDCDFECTMVVAEIERTETKIFWKRIGMDKSETYKNKENVGKEVKWFIPLMSFEFLESEYLKLIEDFRMRYDFEKNEYDKYCKTLQ